MIAGTPAIPLGMVQRNDLDSLRKAFCTHRYAGAVPVQLVCEVKPPVAVSLPQLVEPIWIG